MTRGIFCCSVWYQSGKVCCNVAIFSLRPVRFLQHSEVYYSMLQHACAVGASVCDVTAV